MKIRIITVLAALLLITLCACQSTQGVQNDQSNIYVYDLGSDMSHIEAKEYYIDIDGDISASVGNLLQRILDGPHGNRVLSAIPEEITSVTYVIGQKTVGVNFNSAYNEVSKMRRILCEAAIVKTLCQLDDVYAVSFSVEGVPLCDSDNIPVGLLTPDSFVENDGSMINTYERAQLRLYFASEDGRSLVEKVESVTYNGNISTDRLIVDNIVRGPRSTDAFATVNPETRVNSVTTQDGVCYVNLSKDFLNKITNVTDEVMVYSIVNSLTDLTNINKVQILIDGDMNVSLGEFDLSKMYERNLEMTN